MSNVVEIGEFRLTRKSAYDAVAGCRHLHTTLDKQGDVITCDDCHKQVSATWVLCELLETYRRRIAALQAERIEVATVGAKQLHMKAAQRVERAWRSQSMVPTCPHCDEAIFPTDGLGGGAINREIAERRRAARAEKKDKP